MLRKQEKNALVRAVFLALGWGLGLDRFYEGDNKGGTLSLIGWGLVITSFGYFKCSGYEYVDGVKNYADYSPSPWIIIPTVIGLYGLALVVRKAFRLAKQFENAE